MGNASSKQSSVFEPKVPTEVSDNLKNAVSEIHDTDFALDQKQQTSVQRQLAKALKSAEQAAVQNLDKAYSSLKDSKLNDKDGVVADLAKKVESLHSELEKRPKKGVLNKEALKAREDLVKCFTENKTKPLLCYEQFEEFEKVVARSS